MWTHHGGHQPTQPGEQPIQAGSRGRISCSVRLNPHRRDIRWYLATAQGHRQPLSPPLSASFASPPSPSRDSKPGRAHDTSWLHRRGIRSATAPSCACEREPPRGYERNPATPREQVIPQRQRRLDAARGRVGLDAALDGLLQPPHPQLLLEAMSAKLDQRGAILAMGSKGSIRHNHPNPRGIFIPWPAASPRSRPRGPAVSFWRSRPNPTSAFLYRGEFTLGVVQVQWVVPDVGEGNPTLRRRGIPVSFRIGTGEPPQLRRVGARAHGVEVVPGAVE